MTTVSHVLRERGFIYQYTDEDMFRQLDEKPQVFYIGFDPSADSLHIGNLIPIMSMMHLQRAGHKPIAIVGGGTGLVGDPSGKTEMRQLLDRDTMDRNVAGITQVLTKYLDMDKTIVLNNADWLGKLNYIDMLREFGRHISVNRMLAAESVKTRLEKGLSFLEFNYMILQAYDFYYLCREYGCRYQFGGQDQWGNIVQGIDIIRRKLQKTAYGATWPLIVKPNGEKYGKTEAGAVWLSKDKLSPYQYYQFFRNVEDCDVKRFLLLYTFLPMEEAERLAALQPPLLNRAKEILAFEATRITHGLQDAQAAFQESTRLFGQADPNGQVATSSAITRTPGPSSDIAAVSVADLDVAAGIPLVDFLVDQQIFPSKGQARRMISQGGVYLNDQRLDDPSYTLTGRDFPQGDLLLRKGKKRYYRFTMNE